jgi:thiamine-monophosphate kinase
MELEFLNWLRQRLPPHPQLLLGPGDDAAVLRLAQQSGCVLTVDLVSDEVDFILEQVGPQRAGYKALAVNLSDLAAMAAKPLAAVVALLLPRKGALALAQGIYEGMLPLAQRYQVAIAGGDVNVWNYPLAVSVTLIGQTTPRGPLLRSGARPGDWIVVTGQFGGSILGRHLVFSPRVEEALLLHQQFELHAGIDVSDGLALDLWRLTRASGCGATLRMGDVPIAPDAFKLAQQSGGTPLEHALHDGEDFELILALPPDAARAALAEQPLGDVQLTCVGEFHAQQGLWQITPNGQRQPLAAKGFIHG